MQPETSYRLFVCQGRCQFAYCSINTVVCESQLIVVWNDGGKLLGKQSEEHDGKYLLSVVAIPLVLRSCMESDLLIVVQEWVCRRVKEMENVQRIMLLLVEAYLTSDGNCKLGIFFVLKILIVVFLVVSSQ